MNAAALNRAIVKRYRYAIEEACWSVDAGSAIDTALYRLTASGELTADDQRAIAEYVRRELQPAGHLTEAHLVENGEHPEHANLIEEQARGLLDFFSESE